MWWVVASVSCNLRHWRAGKNYAQMVIPLHKGDVMEREALLRRLSDLQYTRNGRGFWSAGKLQG